jgi:transcriptional regulator with XRE-family HTH domain
MADRKVGRYTNIGMRIMSKGGTQAKVAKMMSISQQTVSKKLRGETAILLADLETLAKKMKVSPAWFLEGYDGMPSAMPKKAKKAA